MHPSIVMALLGRRAVLYWGKLCWRDLPIRGGKRLQGSTVRAGIHQCKAWGLNMKLIIKAAIIAAALGASAAASADTFDFTYTFLDGQQVTGSFLGTTTDGGQSVANISDLQVAFNN